MLLDFLFPKTCLSCGRVGNYLCLKCQKQIISIDQDRCFYCNRPSFLGYTHTQCAPHEIDGILSVFYYSLIIRRIIKGLKYKLITDAFEEFFCSVNPLYLSKFIEFRRLHPFCFFQPIPLYTNKEKIRGFNQSEIITCFFQRFTCYPIVHNLKRIKETIPQAQIRNIKERRRNIRGAFKPINKNYYRDKTIILVDDVVTTGSTAIEAAKEIKKSGAEKVFVFTLSQG